MLRCASRRQGGRRVRRGRAAARAAVALLIIALTAGLAPGPLAPLAREAAASSHETYHLRNALGGGAADIAFRYGRAGDLPITGDWNGDGNTTIGIVRGRTFHLRNSSSGGSAHTTFTFGRQGDLPIVGDWNGDGQTTIGVQRGRQFFLRNDNSGGSAHHSFTFGRESDLPITGDWNGDGRTTVGIVRDGHFHLRNSHSGGNADHSFRYGRDTDLPITGDWNSNGQTTVGIVRDGHFHLRDAHAGGVANRAFRYGRATDIPLTGDWNGNGQTTVGIVRYPARTSCEGGAWSDADTPVADLVEPASLLGLAPPTGGAANRARNALLNANRYALTTHYNARYRNRAYDRYADVQGDFPSTEERAIRLPASTALSVAVSLRTGAYDAQRVGRSEEFAYDYVAWLARSVACQHRSITAGGWPATQRGPWQSAFWAYLAGKAGWLVWDRLAPEDRFYVARMVENEANRFIDYDVPYWKDADGNEVFRGDSKAEENSWNANILQLATAMMPEHPNWDAWQHKNVQLLLSSYSVPGDLDDDESIHGQPLSAWLDGWNANPDGTVINHRRINPDYMTTIHQNWSAAMTYGLAGMPAPRAAFHNAELVYGAMTNVVLDPADGYEQPGGTFYQDSLSPRVYFPEGCSWGRNRPAPFYNLDAMAGAFGVDGLIDRGAGHWERVHVDEQLRLQGIDFDGRTYHGTRPRFADGCVHDEDYYYGREEYVSQIVSFAWLAKYVTAHAPFDLADLDDTDYAPEAEAPSVDLQATPPPEEDPEQGEEPTP